LTVASRAICCRALTVATRGIPIAAEPALVRTVARRAIGHKRSIAPTPFLTGPAIGWALCAGALERSVTAPTLLAGSAVCRAPTTAPLVAATFAVGGIWAIPTLPLRCTTPSIVAATIAATIGLTDCGTEVVGVRSLFGAVFKGCQGG
jgi:hypothetical protein